jgi:PKD repeat protein
VRLFEGQSRFDIIYGELNGTGSAATVGEQKDTGGLFTQFECNSGGLSTGLQLTFQRTCTDGGGQCAGALLASFSGAPTSGAAPLTVSFTNLSAGTTNYRWSFGDGHVSTATNAANTYSNAGSYTVSLQAVGPGGTNTLVRNNYVVLSNAPPVLARITNRILLEETLLTFTANASDADVSQTLAFSLDPPVPEGASINATSGLFTWAPSLAFASTTNSITVRVTDDGSPAAFDAQAFDVTVVANPRLLSIAEAPEGVFTFLWQVYPGRTYRSEFKTNLTEATWTPSGADFTAATSSATVTNNAGTNLHGFHRVLDVTGP